MIRISTTKKSNEPSNDVLLCIKDFNFNMGVIDILKTSQIKEQGIRDHIQTGVSYYCNDEFFVRVELYILDPYQHINTNDWYYDDYCGLENPVKKCYIPGAIDEGSYKIISTTDKNLNECRKLSENEIEDIIIKYNQTI